MIEYALSFFSGAFGKTADRMENGLGFFAGAAYGVTGGLAAALFPRISPLFLGLVAGNLFAGKFDSRAHQVGLAAFLAVLVFSGLPPVEAGAFALLASTAFADEVIAGYAKKIRRKKAVGTPGFRPLTPLACLAYWLLTGAYEPLAAIIAFDSGYVLAGLKVI